MKHYLTQVFQSYKDFWIRFLDVNGRSNRADFWHPFWINFIISSLLGLVSAGFLSSLFGLVILIPTFTVMVRRLHDINWRMIFAIIVFCSWCIGPVYLLVLFIFLYTGMLYDGAGDKYIWLAYQFSQVLIFVNIFITIFALYVLARPGHKTPNKYGSGGSCEVVPEVSNQ
ncbi:DUF805 domain-containing protein [Mammaliicoccus stepanovicii]|uniref:Predicted membrane protein n=1 Tax=Mammaliicoccus stepanovicii TaxID=643214 RepID=A0A239Y5H1_9STAP|nr:DUF805 domain-containing protein [Mammaliicoccus stepanovicii]PNZ78983.1 DUF805 domain-containing protein [Mammaliicoccus stepanovicii]GGI43385.1 hypothetical protein GCM10010896_23160 [Mammaliicoccus stepanovicii]SNV54439.1 Predicted membrane protein [Mammaliicoccus stepanovicii]